MARGKLHDDADSAVSVIGTGSVVMVGGFGDSGVPFALVEALVRRRPTDLTIIANNCGTGERGLALLFKNGLVRRVIASFPAQVGNHHFAEAFHSGRTELVLVPQGTLAERIRAAGAGLGGVLTPTGVGTMIAEGKRVVEVGGREFLMEEPLHADFALVKAAVGDTLGNLRYRLAGRNFNPVMAMAAGCTIAQISRLVPLGTLAPDDIHTPGVFVDRVYVHAEGAR